MDQSRSIKHTFLFECTEMLKHNSSCQTICNFTLTFTYKTQDQKSTSIWGYLNKHDK